MATTHVITDKEQGVSGCRVETAVPLFGSLDAPNGATEYHMDVKSNLELSVNRGASSDDEKDLSARALRFCKDLRRGQTSPVLGPQRRIFSKVFNKILPDGEGSGVSAFVSESCAKPQTRLDACLVPILDHRRDGIAAGDGSVRLLRIWTLRPLQGLRTVLVQEIGAVAFQKTCEVFSEARPECGVVQALKDARFDLVSRATSEDVFM